MRISLPRRVADAGLEAYAAAHSTPPPERLRDITAATREWSVAADPRVEAVMLTVRDGITLIRVRD